MGNKTALYAAHQESGAKLVDFGGWDMPLHYGSQLDEHHIVRQDAGMFDVSHMTVVDVRGVDAKAYLRYIFANDVDRLKELGKAMYSGLLNEQGGVIDDLIVYNMGSWYRVVVNCGTREKDLAWMNKQSAEFDIEIIERPELAMIAVQGPNAREKVASVSQGERAELIQGLKIFQGLQSDAWFIARTGYTGEDGLEIVLPAEDAVEFWNALKAAGVSPIGLGARDTLRLEAGMNLYGNDMDETVNPLAANMAWTIAWEPSERDFIGRKALEKIRAAGCPDKLVGLVLEGRGVLRAHQKVVVEGLGEGEITSGTFSPTLKHSIAMARVPKATGDSCQVEMRGKLVDVRVIKPSFVRNGKKVFE